jgi:hypothetical protein
MTAPFDRKGAMKKPPGHDARRPLLRLPVSRFRRYYITTGLRPEGSTCKEKPAGGRAGPVQDQAAALADSIAW